MDLQEEKMQEDYNKRHGDNINNSAAQFNLGYSSSLEFQSSITTENIDEQIETLGNNIKLYEEYINLLDSDAGFLQDFKNNSIRFGKELSSEYLQQNYIYQPGYFTDYYHNTIFLSEFF